MSAQIIAIGVKQVMLAVAFNDRGDVSLPVIDRDRAKSPCRPLKLLGYFQLIVGLPHYPCGMPQKLQNSAPGGLRPGSKSNNTVDGG